MLTLLGSLLGFLSSLAPEVMRLWGEAADHRREVEVMRLQMEAQRLAHTQRLEEINTEADVRVYEAAHANDRPTGIPWVEALRGSVRPIITYAFFLLFAWVQVALVSQAVATGQPLSVAVPAIWTEDVQALFAAIISFWFGGRAIDKTREKLPWLRS